MLYTEERRARRRDVHCPSLSRDRPSLGSCPNCETERQSVHQLIESEENDGATGVSAECPSRTDVVEPT
ncbi:DUF7837 family putative zinc-binding protein [Halomicrobium urmianum]|uniref:DUF7837 family putative zinc-binding protein n=1 Tax=Halomicrobium urmianum TaxID=1586233 RepID=UPI00402B2769